MIFRLDSYRVRCDVCDALDGDGYTTREAAIILAAYRGWQLGDKHLCPACKAKAEADTVVLPEATWTES